MAALAAPDLVVAELVAEHVTRAPARPGALVAIALVAAVIAELEPQHARHRRALAAAGCRPRGSAG